MLSAPVAASRELCGVATGASFTSGTMDIASPTPSLSYQTLESISAFVRQARHTAGTPELMTICERCIGHNAIVRFSPRTLPSPRSAERRQMWEWRHTTS